MSEQSLSLEQAGPCWLVTQAVASLSSLLEGSQPPQFFTKSATGDVFHLASGPAQAERYSCEYWVSL